MKTLALAVTLLLMVALLVPAVAKDMPDVPFGHWAYDAVDELTDLGVVEGYPDGTFKGDRTWTRYEFAVMLTRMIDFLEDYLDSKVAGMDMGITESAARAIAREEAQKAAAGVQLPDVQAFMNQVNSTATSAGAAAAREALAGYKPGISKAEAQAMIDAAVKNFVDKGALDAMAQEFRGELAMLGADVDDLMYRVDALETKFAALEARVTALENKPDKVTGELKWKAGTVNDGSSWNRFSNLEVKVNIDGKISDKAQGHVTLWRPDATYDWDERGTHIDTAYVDVQDGLFNGFDWRFGKQYYKTGCGLTFDNDVMPTEAVKLNFDLLGADATVFWGTSDYADSWFGYDNEMVTLLYNLKKKVGKLTLDGTFVDRNLWNSEQRWGIAAMYDGLDVPFFGLKADLEGEYTQYDKPWTSYNSYYTGATLKGKNYEPGDWKLKLTFADNPYYNDYWPYQNGFITYDGFVWYSNLAWDFLLSEAPNLGIPYGKTWSATLTKDLGCVDALLRWRKYVPDNAAGYIYLDSWGYSYLYNQGDLWQLSLTKELTEGVDAILTYAQLNDDYYDETYKYFGGSINVGF